MLFSLFPFLGLVFWAFVFNVLLKVFFLNVSPPKNLFWTPSGGGHGGLMVMALDCGAGGREFKPRRFQHIFDLMERFDKTV